MSENNLPDKCDLCGLKETYPPDTKNVFRSLRLLFDEGIIPTSFSRKMYVSVGDDENDRDDFCLISHPSWFSKEQPCESWQLDMGLSKGDVLSINLASESTKAAKETERLTKTIKLFTMVIVVFTILQILLSLKPDIQRWLSMLVG